MKAFKIRSLIPVFVPAFLVLGVIALISVRYQIEMHLITRDVASIGKVHPLAGLLSSLGILLWAAAASVSLFSAFLLRNVRRIAEARFLLASSVLSAYLMLDDLFLFHEELAGYYLGIDQNVVLVGLCVFVVAYLLAFRKIILDTNYILLLLGLGFLSCSVIVDTHIFDLWLRQIGHWRMFVEDGFKWLGIAGWCGYCVHASFTFCRESGS